MLEVFLGVLMFTFVILSLVVVLMFARSKLVTSGQVNIVINDDESKAVRVETGTTLLNSLAAQKIFIPSA